MAIHLPAQMQSGALGRVDTFSHSMVGARWPRACFPRSATGQMSGTSFLEFSSGGPITGSESVPASVNREKLRATRLARGETCEWHKGWSTGAVAPYCLNCGTRDRFDRPYRALCAVLNETHERNLV